MDELRQIVVHPVLWDRLSGWLVTQNVNLVRIADEEDDLPTYIMQPIVFPGA